MQSRLASIFRYRNLYLKMAVSNISRESPEYWWDSSGQNGCLVQMRRLSTAGGNKFARDVTLKRKSRLAYIFAADNFDRFISVLCYTPSSWHHFISVSISATHISYRCKCISCSVSCFDSPNSIPFRLCTENFCLKHP